MPKSNAKSAAHSTRPDAWTMQNADLQEVRREGTLMASALATGIEKEKAKVKAVPVVVVPVTLDTLKTDRPPIGLVMTLMEKVGKALTRKRLATMRRVEGNLHHGRADAQDVEEASSYGMVSVSMEEVALSDLEKKVFRAYADFWDGEWWMCADAMTRMMMRAK